MIHYGLHYDHRNHVNLQFNYLNVQLLSFTKAPFPWHPIILLNPRYFYLICFATYALEVCFFMSVQDSLSSIYMSSCFGFIFHVQLKTFFNEISNTKGWARRFPNYVCTVYGWPQVKLAILLSKWIQSMVSGASHLCDEIRFNKSIINYNRNSISLLVSFELW